MCFLKGKVVYFLFDIPNTVLCINIIAGEETATLIMFCLLIIDCSLLNQYVT
jgi:hypothetical protein